MRTEELTEAASRSELMRGGCFALALWLHKRTKLPLWGLFDQYGLMHHAFVADHEYAYDARGKVPLKQVGLSGGRSSAGTEMRPTTVAEVTEMALDQFSDRELANYVRREPGLAQLLLT